jgi:hypothetical protein
MKMTSRGNSKRVCEKEKRAGCACFVIRKKEQVRDGRARWQEGKRAKRKVLCLS